MAGGAACAVSCRSGMLAKSSCSATPMARARTTIFPSLAPAETKNGKQVRDGTERQRRAVGKDERGQSDMEVGVAQRGQRRRERSRQVQTGNIRGYKQRKQESRVPPREGY